MPITSRVRARPQAGGFSARLIYLDSTGTEQVAFFSTTSSPEKILQGGVSIREAFAQAFASVRCELMSVQVMVEGSAPLEALDPFEFDVPAAVPRCRPKLTLVPKAAIGVAAAIGAALLQACIRNGGDPTA